MIYALTTITYKGSRVFKTRAQIAKRMGVSRPTANKAIDEAIEKKLMVKCDEGYKFTLLVGEKPA